MGLPIVVIAANVPTLGSHALMTIAILGFLFFAWVMPNLTLEAGYLTYLKIRDRKCLLIIFACFAGLYGVMALIDLMVF